MYMKGGDIGCYSRDGIPTCPIKNICHLEDSNPRLPGQ